MKAILVILCLLFPLSVLAQDAVTPYVATAEDLEIEDGVLNDFIYSGEGDDPEWVVIPEDLGIVEIADFGFHKDKREKKATLKRVSLPHSVKRIGPDAFSFCRLTQVDLNPEIEFIGYCAFQDNKLVEVSLPPSLKQCGLNAFTCGSLTKINWHESPNCPIDVLSGFACDTNLRYIEIPSYVKALGYDAFRNVCPDSIKLNEGLDSISGAFFNDRLSYDGSKLKKVEFPNSLRYIDHVAFAANTALESIKFGEGLTMIGYGCFTYNISLQSVAFPENLTYIGTRAFKDCIKLRSVAFNSKLTEIGYQAFRHCPELYDYRLPDGLEKLGVEAFRGTAIADLRIPGGIKVVPKQCFSYCTYKKGAKITFAEGVEEIADSAFYNYVRITESSTFTDSVTLSLPSTLRRIGNSAFEMVWVRQTPLPQVDENGGRLKWQAYLRGELEVDDVKYIGGYMATGFQRAGLYEYIAKPREDDDPQTLKPVTPGNHVVNTEYFSLSGVRTSAPSKGVNIVRRTYSDGSVVTEKTLVK